MDYNLEDRDNQNPVNLICLFCSSSGYKIQATGDVEQYKHNVQNIQCETQCSMGELDPTLRLVQCEVNEKSPCPRMSIIRPTDEGLATSPGEIRGRNST